MSPGDGVLPSTGWAWYSTRSPPDRSSPSLVSIARHDPSDAPVSGSVAPESHLLEGSFLLAVKDGLLEATPEFPDLGLRLKIEPSAEAWASVDKVIEERGFKCRTALKMVNIQGVLKDLLDNGFDES